MIGFTELKPTRKLASFYIRRAAAPDRGCAGDR
jgi:hypothetical protein